MVQSRISEKIPPGALSSPGSHPHSDRLNWQPASTLDEYIQNCREGLEQYSDRRAARIMGWSRSLVWRAKLLAKLPPDLFERLLESDVPRLSTKALAQASVFLRELQTGEISPAEVETCPHCGEILRVRSRVNAGLAKIVVAWVTEQNNREAPC